MKIEYKNTKIFTEKELQRLFLSVKWESGNYPKKLVNAMRNSTHVISAWDNECLVGLVQELDDGETVAFIHYLLVVPKYQGLHIGDMLMKHLMGYLDKVLYIKIMPSDPKTILFYQRYRFKQYENYSAMVIKNFD